MAGKIGHNHRLSAQPLVSLRRGSNVPAVAPGHRTFSMALGLRLSPSNGFAATVRCTAKSRSWPGTRTRSTRSITSERPMPGCYSLASSRSSLALVLQLLGALARMLRLPRHYPPVARIANGLLCRFEEKRRTQSSSPLVVSVLMSFSNSSGSVGQSPRSSRGSLLMALTQSRPDIGPSL